eukprot:NODE_12702_length_225_cov_50.119318_g10932_i0.p5 GENE.NODE_12702_length_225_cov_50.119318_g10932_i0~~NODE_12702_length_225_cov_50.119318_g10932_i0.p5  ORF type:complete len:67 (-),score=31.69 NODE_12702_length_225_cov_50.119318_g10932_i0:24-203(-)
MGAPACPATTVSRAVAPPTTCRTALACVCMCVCVCVGGRHVPAVPRHSPPFTRCACLPR